MLRGIGRVGSLSGQFQFLVHLSQKLPRFLCVSLHILSVVFLCDGDVPVGFDYMALRCRQIGVDVFVNVEYRFLRPSQELNNAALRMVPISKLLFVMERALPSLEEIEWATSLTH